MACRDIDVHKALALMEAARLLQPDDPEVGAKIEEYCHMLRLENASV